ncbi:MAG: tetratricopeptide repeat protein [Anaerolineae bacterium]|jgi:tetratricopeptide (TPR) repeat protein|nr:tetratricopeptide repeat protein [Anaerolineae bacterium]
MLITRGSRYRRSRARRWRVPFAILNGIIAGVLVWGMGWVNHLMEPAPSNPAEAEIEAAERAFDNGDLDGAVAAAERAFAAQPQHPRAALHMARALVYRSYVDYDGATDRRRALELTNAALQAHPDDPDALAARAFALHADGQSLEAYRLAERALRRDARHTFARLTLGLAYAGVGAFERGLSEVRQAVRAGDQAVDALRAQAVVQSDSGRYRDAASSIDQAIALNRALIPLHFERALYALQIGDSGAANTAYLRVLALDSGNVKAHLRLCELNSTLRQREDALRYCQRVPELAPDWSKGWHALGREYFLGGDFREAQTALNRCSTLEVLQGVAPVERTFDCWYLQGQAAELNGDCPALLTTYNEFRAMSASGAFRETWVYPPEGPAACVTNP